MSRHSSLFTPLTPEERKMVQAQLSKNGIRTLEKINEDLAKVANKLTGKYPTKKTMYELLSQGEKLRLEKRAISSINETMHRAKKQEEKVSSTNCFCRK